MAIFGSGFIIIHKSWTDLKNIVYSRHLVFQYDETDELYQVFAVDDAIVFLTTIYKNNIPTSSDISQIQNDLDKDDFLNNYQSKTNLPASSLSKNRSKMVEINFRKDLIEQTTYFLAVDKDNPDGYYKHDNGTAGGVKIAGMTGLIIKSKMADAWSIRLGTVLSIDAEQCRIGWLRLGTMIARNTGENQSESQQTVFPLLMDCTVSNGNFTAIATNYYEVTTEVNTNTPIEDISGTYRIAAPGDIIIRPTKFSGDGSLLFNYHIWYLVE